MTIKQNLDTRDGEKYQKPSISGRLLDLQSHPVGARRSIQGMERLNSQ